MSKEEFYVGWQDDAPKSYTKIGKRFVLIVFLVFISFVWFFTRTERPFIDSYFDYGNLTELEGHLILKPVPAVSIGKDEGKEIVPLVGFGKYGAKPTIEAYDAEAERPLQQGDYVKVRGTIFTYQDRRWMELTEGSESFLSVKEGDYVRNNQFLGRQKVTGEIVDPKCFFGVMNPAVKAIHRSCAIRCISGGIPALLAIRENGAFTDYYFLLNDEGEPVGNEVLPYVGVPISLEGDVGSIDKWKTMTVSFGQNQIAFLNSSNDYLCQ